MSYNETPYERRRGSETLIRLLGPMILTDKLNAHSPVH